MTKQKQVYLVMMDVGGLFGVYYEHDRATSTAQAIKGTVAAVPILEDYRP
jgi:hypothetical protein